MSYAIEVADGDQTITSRANPVFTATARIDAITNFGAGFTVGDIVKVTGAGVNNGIYTVAALITGTRIFDVAEGGITTAGAGGQCDWYSNNSTTLQASTAITNFLVGSIIQAAGALFVTNGVRKNDTAIVLGAGTTLSGAYRVTEVISETQIRVAGASKGKTAFGASAGAGTVQVRAGSWLASVLDETSPSWTALRSGATGPDGSTGADFIDRRTLGNRLTMFTTHGLRRIRLDHTLNSASTWVSEREVVIADRVDAVDCDIVYGTGATPGDLVRIGRAGVDRYGADFGSAWIGWRPTASSTAPGPADSLSCSLYLSYMNSINATNSGSLGTGNQGSFIASMIDGYLMYAPGGFAPVIGAVFTGTIESMISRSPSFAVTLLGSPASYDNVLVTEAGSAGFMVGVTGFLQGLLASDDVPTPYFQLLGSDVTVLNPRADYTLVELFTVFSGTGTLSYTWSPRFVQRGSGVPLAIPGLSVRVFEVNESTLVETEIAGSPFTTNASGFIPAQGPGATQIGHGIDLRRGLALPLAANTLLSHRMIVEGAGYRRIDSYFTMRAPKINFDLPVDILRTDFEGEFST